MPKVSIITPTYNAAKFIGETIESVLVQTFSDWELIIVDDGSTDETVTIAKRYAHQHPDRIQVHPQTHTGLPSATRNAAMYFAQGEYLAFLDGDDIWEKNKLEETIKAFANDRHLGVISTAATIIGSEKLYPLPQSAGPVKYRQLTHANGVITSTAVVRRTILNEVGVQNTDPKIFGYEDYEFWLRLASRTKIELLDQALTRYRQNPQGISLTIGGGAKDVLAKIYMFQQILKTKLSPLQKLLTMRAIRKMNRQITTENKSNNITDTARLTSAHVPVCYHLGCGEVYLPGYINVDDPNDSHTLQADSKKVDLFHDITTIDYPAGGVDEIRLHHVFEHFTYSGALNLLQKWHRGLKLGGKLTIETPDIEACSQTIFNTATPFAVRQRVMRHVYGSHEAFWAHHYDGWYEEKYRQILPCFGFKVIKVEKTEYRKLSNIIVHAERNKLLTKTELLAAIKTTLEDYLVDRSSTEEKLLNVWMKEIKLKIDEDTSHS